MTLMLAPGAGGLVIGFSRATFMSVLGGFAAWLSSLTATSSVLGSGTATTLTGMLSLASPFFSFFWMACQTWSAAALLAGDLSRQESTSSQSLKESWSGGFCWTAWAAKSQGVGASLMLATKSGGGAVCDAAVVTRCCQSSRLPWYFLYLAWK